MTRARHAVFACATLMAALARAATPAPDIRTDDVDRFYAVYDAAQGKPSAEALQSRYLDPGSPGLHQFVDSRIGSAAKLAAAIAGAPAIFADARRCTAALPAVRARLPAVFAALAELDPSARFPPVTIVIGRNSTGGTTTAGGVIIGLETMCRTNWMQPDMAERLLHLIAHEYAHVQQPAADGDPPPGATMLFQALLEGGAEFIGEATSGEISNAHLLQWTRGHECGIERDFARDATGSDLSHWLYNGPGTPEQPGDLGYWVGYRIVKAYYARAPDKRRAVAEILALDDGNAEAFLARSGWAPATDCALAAAAAGAAAPIHPPPRTLP